MMYLSGRVYEGFWSKGRRHGKGFERFTNGDVYIGDYFKGKAHGKGKRTWAETNESYVGEWHEGMRHGIGNWTYNHKDVNRTPRSKQVLSELYVGAFQNNQFQGFGIFTVTYKMPVKEKVNSADLLSVTSEQVELKDVYEGEWHESRKHGKGTETYSNGDMFVGHFIAGDYNGMGKYKWANCSSYKGQFVQGKKKGKGKWIVKDTAPGLTSDEQLKRSSVYQGDFDDDCKQGFGTMIWHTGGRYDGHFIRNKRHGQGKMIWGDSTTYQGAWKNGRRDGFGELVTKGKRLIGLFEQNMFVKDQSFVFDGI
jgi:hypothetical protein